MNTKITVELSEAEQLQARRRAEEEGFASVGEYVDALVRDDLGFSLNEEWIRARVQEGLASEDFEVLTEERLHQLVSEGMARAKKRE